MEHREIRGDRIRSIARENHIRADERAHNGSRSRCAERITRIRPPRKHGWMVQAARHLHVRREWQLSYYYNGTIRDWMLLYGFPQPHGPDEYCIEAAVET